MKVINIEQGDPIWHIYRHRSVGGTRFQSAVGAVMMASGEMIVGGIKWAIIDGKIAKTELLTATALKKCKGDLELISKVRSEAILVNAVKCKAIQETLMLKMISENRSVLEFNEYQNASMERGHALEPASVAAGSERLGLKLTTIGMLQSDIHPLLKYSPDAVHINEKGVIDGGYETKAKQGEMHIEYLTKNVLPKEHFWQCLCPMVMDKAVTWWVFAHYDDRDMIDPLFLTGIKRADYLELIELCEVIIADFFTELHRRTIEMGGYFNDPLIEQYCNESKLLTEK